MTYVPPDRNGDDESGQGPDQTQNLATVPGALPSVGNGDAGGQAAPYRPEAQPTAPFESDFSDTEVAPAPPADARPPRDRIVFQLIWEVVLVLLAANALFMVYRQRDELFGDVALADAVDAQLMIFAPVLVLATALAMSLRLGAVNLSVPAIAYLVVSVPSLFVGSNPWIGLGWTAAAAGAMTVLFVVLTLGFRVPAWAAGLALAFTAIGGVRFAQWLAADFGSAAHTWTAPDGRWIFLGAAAVSLAGGLLGLIPSVRNRFSLVKGAVEGTERRAGASVAALLGGTFVSLLLAGGAGFLAAVFFDFGESSGPFILGAYDTTDGVTAVLAPFVLIAVLLGGTSLWGRRGGVAGTLLATVLLGAVMLLWANYTDFQMNGESYESWQGLLYGGMFVVGAVVSVGLDRLGRPKAKDEDDMAMADPGPFTPAPPSLFDPNAEAPVPGGLR